MQRRGAGGPPDAVDPSMSTHLREGTIEPVGAVVLKAAKVGILGERQRGHQPGEPVSVQGPVPRTGEGGGRGAGGGW
jgi:hypothetical protein